MWFSAERTVELELWGQPLSIVQDNESMHVGTSVWEASLVFAKWLEKNSDNGECELSRVQVTGKRAIELGTGCGIAAMAMALAGADVLATDIQAVIPILKKNLKRNMASISDSYKAAFATPGKARPVQLHWGNDKHIKSAKPPFDFVIVTDVVYLEEDVRKLIDTMVAVSDRETIIVLGYRLRQEEAHELFWKVLPERFFVVRQVDKAELHEGFTLEGVDLYILKLK
eukprot:TRINITY_DN79445_c0_g1_i1.p1 TRINITY_DN79445_c0_g1~~TRINITY_DN79445_c0_g1_i1.p1  ORF type:complete len:227 (+),score=19.60 TRINITY_DN79445_c0_g1_i1:27-707(+)